jgi:phosphate transport system protein
MIKALRAFFHKESLLEQAMQDTHAMLANVQSMVEAAVQTLRHTESTDLSIDVAAMDAAVNTYEESVRRKVFTHLSLMGNDHIYPGLVLVSIIIDVERIGDYAKNIVVLASRHPERLSVPRHDEELTRIEQALITQIMPDGRRNFEQGLEQEAAKLIRDYRWVGRSCEQITEDLSTQAVPGDSRTLVCMALYARYLKRITSHWLNVQTAIANPFDRIGVKKDI